MQPSLKDSWLSGFTEAEGCFNVNIIKRQSNKLGYRTKLRFILDQKDINALIYIRNLFKTGLVYNRKASNNVKKNYLLPPSINSITNNSRYVAESLSGMSNIINYYNRYPLKTIKKEAYQKWVNVYLMMKLKKHLNKEGLIEIRELASLINKKPEFSSSSIPQVVP